MALTPKRRLFVEYYLQCFNATEAARRAGYNHGRSSQEGYELRREPEIKEEISRRMAEVAMAADEVLHHLGEMARGEYARYVTPQGFDIRACCEDGNGRFLKSIKRSKAGTSYEFYDRLGALNTLARGHGLLTENVNLNLIRMSDEELAADLAGESPRSPEEGSEDPSGPTS